MSVLRLGDYLKHMREAVGLACSYVDGVTKKTFLMKSALSRPWC